MFLGRANSFKAELIVNGVGPITISPTTTSNNPTLLSLVVNTASGGVGYANGTFTSTVGSAGGLLLSTDTYLIGGNDPGFVGFVYEVIVFNNTVSTFQQQQIEGYLASKWGLQANLPATHPYSATASVPFNRPFYPTDIGGCALWLDAADASTITGTTSVTAWADKSGTGNNMTITGGTVTYTTNPLAVTFPRAQVSCTSALSTNVVTAGSSSMFMVLQADDMNATGICMAFTCVNIAGGDYSLRFQTAVTKIRVSATNDIGSNYFVNGTLGTPVANVITVPAGLNIIDTTFTLSGTTQFALSAPASLPDPLPTRFFLGPIQEVIVYTDPTTTAQRQQVEQYLANKWGLVSKLPAGHPGKLLPAFSTPFTPKSITGCQLWLDAAEPSTITGTSPVTAWRDKSGNGLVAGVNNSLTRPSFITTGNGKPAIQFLPSQAFNVTGFNYTTAWSAICCMNTVDIGAGRFLISPFSGLGITLMSMNPGVSGNKIFGSTLTATNITGENIENTSVQNSAASGLLDYFRNGVLINQITGSIGVNATANVTLGIGANATGNFNMDGTYNMYEILIYNSRLSTSQRQQVEGYLAWKWGLQSSLPSTHAYAKFRP
jgi:hypothetical protein